MKNMKPKIISFILLYVLVPLIIIPFLSIKSGNLFGLFGIAFYYIGIVIAKSGQWIFFPIPLFFTFWYWYTYGFGPKDFVTLYFLCIVSGSVLCVLNNMYHKYVHGILPENELNEEYNDKLSEMEQRIEKYRMDHPDQKMTQEIIEKIKTDIFFK